MRWLTNPVAQFLAAGFVTLVVVVLATSALSRSAADEEAIADARSLTWVLARSVAQPAIPPGLTRGRRGRHRPHGPYGARPAAGRRRAAHQAVGRRRHGALQRPHRADRRASTRSATTSWRCCATGGPMRSCPTSAGRRTASSVTWAETCWRSTPASVRPRASRSSSRPTSASTTSARAGRRSSTGSCPSPSAPWSPSSRSARRWSCCCPGGCRVPRASASACSRPPSAPRTPSGCASPATSTTGSCRTWPARPWPSRRCAAHADEPDRRELEEVGRSLRASMRSLRSLLVEIYPPDLHTAGLGGRGHDLVAPLVGGRRRRSTSTSAATTERPVRRSRCCGGSRRRRSATWRATPDADRMSLTVRHEDDRPGAGGRRRRGRLRPGRPWRPSDHFGLRAAESLVREHGGTWRSSPRPGSGTTVRVEVPVG